MPRTLIETTQTFRVYRVTDADGNTVGYDEEAIASPEEINRRSIEDAARQAVLDNRTFLAIASPTNAQTLAQVKALTRQMNAAMRLVLQQFNGID